MCFEFAVDPQHRSNPATPSHPPPFAKASQTVADGITQGIYGVRLEVSISLYNSCEP